MVLKSYLFLQNRPEKSFTLPLQQNVLHIPIPLDQNLSYAVQQSPAASENDHSDDPPIVSRLMKMGFRRSKILAIYDPSIRNEGGFCRKF